MTFFSSNERVNGDECGGDGAGDSGGVRASSVMSEGGSVESGHRGSQDKASSDQPHVIHQPHVIVLCPITQFEQACRKVAVERAPQGFSDEESLLRPVSSATETEPAVASARGGPYRDDAAALNAAGVCACMEISACVKENVCADAQSWVGTKAGWAPVTCDVFGWAPVTCLAVGFQHKCQHKWTI